MDTLNGIHQLEQLPAMLLDCRADALHAAFPQPTLIHLTGRQPEPLFVSMMLHGNEPTGLLAVQRVLRRYKDTTLPRSLSLFLGNTQAAEQGLRRLEGQPDFNRVWPGTETPDVAEARLMQNIVTTLQSRQVFASIDIHNNTGMNPHYACVNTLASEHLQLASLFGRTVIYFIRPTGTQSAAMGKICPAVTIECGKPAEPHGVEHAADFIEACLHLSHFPETPVAEHDINLFHTVAQVKVPDTLSFSFSSKNVDLEFIPGLERLNFQEVPEGTVLAYCHQGNQPQLEVTNEAGEAVANTYFQCDHNTLKLKRSVMPSMLTQDEPVIRQDCLCYLMERLPFHPGEAQ
ncbi:MAG TPA: peptidase M14 [Gammaproteobacteria bacterium]|nr:peptidase M14 [Gammaproteobacteria bacterium]